MHTDAKSRAREVRGRLRAAYGSHARNLRAAIEEAAKRPAQFTAAWPALIHDGAAGECWRGTKAQLATLGIGLEGPWPREAGGAERWASARDARGMAVSITRPSDIWPDLFEVCITIPFESIRTRASDDILGGGTRRRGLGVAKRRPDHIRSELRLVWSYDRPAIG